jgi:hypothetical protein
MYNPVARSGQSHGIGPATVEFEGAKALLGEQQHGDAFGGFHAVIDD